MIKVFVNGTFDILHPGHIDLLNYAKSCGDYLMVAIDSDCRVQKRKGQNRPINDLYFRKKMMQSIKPVDEVNHFSTDQELTQIIQDYEPHIMVVGSDYCNQLIIGSEYAKELRYFQRIDKYSTTNIINKVTQ